MTWRIAASLIHMREQLALLYPNRSKASDGAIGDAAHASRSSDHNPWVMDGKMGVVTAIDVTHDPKGGCDGTKLAEALRASRDHRIKYIIWNKQICSSSVAPWQWRKYTGSNPHQHHVHISVLPAKGLYDDNRDWHLA